MDREREQARSQMFELARLAMMPWKLTEATKRVRTGVAIGAALTAFLVSVVLPLAVAGAAAGEPYRDLSHFAAAIFTSGLLISVIFTSPVWGNLLIVALLMRAFFLHSQRFRGELRFRAILLAPFAVCIPLAFWCLFLALAQTSQSGFGLWWYDNAGGRPAWLRSSVITLMGSVCWWFAAVLLAIILACKASADLSVLPTYMGDPVCLKCRYNLTGNTSGVCPECGTPISKPKVMPI